MNITTIVATGALLGSVLANAQTIPEVELPSVNALRTLHKERYNALKKRSYTKIQVERQLQSMYKKLITDFRGPNKRPALSVLGYAQTVEGFAASATIEANTNYSRKWFKELHTTLNTLYGVRSAYFKAVKKKDTSLSAMHNADYKKGLVAFRKLYKNPIIIK